MGSERQLSCRLPGSAAPVDVESRHSPLWWHTAGKSYTASGYGRKIPTATKVRIPGETRWRRVYCCIYSNSGTCYILIRGEWAVIS